MKIKITAIIRNMNLIIKLLKKILIITQVGEAVGVEGEQEEEVGEIVEEDKEIEKIKMKKDKFNSNKNKSATILTVRDKKSFHSHSLENDYHTTRPKNTKNSLKTLRNFSLKMMNFWYFLVKLN